MRDELSIQLRKRGNQLHNEKADGKVGSDHYKNMPMQYKEIFKVVKNEKFQLKKFDIFLIFAQNIDCGYTL